MAGVALSELGLAGNPIVPCLGIKAETIVKPSALKQRGPGRVPPVLEQRERALRLVHSSKQDRALQVDVGALLAGDLLGAIELTLGIFEAAEPLLRFSEIGGRFERGGVRLRCRHQERAGVIHPSAPHPRLPETGEQLGMIADERDCPFELVRRLDP